MSGTRPQDLGRGVGPTMTRSPAQGHDPLRRILPLLEVRPAKVAAAIGLGVLALACAIGLAAVAAWLIARASQMPPVRSCLEKPMRLRWRWTTRLTIPSLGALIIRLVLT